MSTGDGWARSHLNAYAQWAKTHNSLLIVTFDEDDRVGGNRIPTLFVGAHVTPGKYREPVDHFRVLRTIEEMYGLPALGKAASRTAITDVFRSQQHGPGRQPGHGYGASHPRHGLAETQRFTADLTEGRRG